MISEKKHTHKSSRETNNEASIRIIKFIAPKVMDVCGKSSCWTKSPCECTDTITCAYCVQASLLFFEENIKAHDEKINKFLSTIKRIGIRKTARKLNVDHSTVKYWIKKGIFLNGWWKNILGWVKCIQSYQPPNFHPRKLLKSLEPVSQKKGSSDMKNRQIELNRICFILTPYL